MKPILPGKVIFLDIDGTLNGDMTCRRPAITTGKFGLLDESYLGIDPKCVQRVNRIVQATQAVIVLSTSWVRALGIKETIKHLRWNGLKGKIIGKTPYKMSSFRNHEINFWLEKNPEVKKTKSFVVLDDSKSLLYFKYQKNLILTNSLIGLTDDDAEKAIQILNREK